VADSTKHGNEPMGFIKDSEFVNLLIYFQILEKTASWNDLR
jgi:hypothetical protein